MSTKPQICLKEPAKFTSICLRRNCEVNGGISTHIYANTGEKHDTIDTFYAINPLMRQNLETVLTRLFIGILLEILLNGKPT